MWGSLLMPIVTYSATAILRVMCQADLPLRTGEVAQLAAISNPTASQHLKGLKEAGLVRRNGAAPRDPHATWSLR